LQMPFTQWLQVKALGSVMTYGGYLHSEKVIVGLGCPLGFYSGSGARYPRAFLGCFGVITFS